MWETPEVRQEPDSEKATHRQLADLRNGILYILNALAEILAIGCL
jgi:hypothetical protein